jgi:flagellar hook-associated protein 2
MDVERVQVTKLEAQIDQKTLVISTLGVFKSKVSALESAAKAIQTPGVFSLRSANSSDATKVSATATNAASAGSYSVKVAQTAQAAVLSVSGFTATNQVVDLSTFSMTHAGVEYSPDYAKFVTTTSFTADDKINFTLTGGTEQSFTVTTQTTVDQVVSAINSAVSAGDLTGVIARKNADGQLQLSSSNAIQGLVAADIELDSGGTETGVVTQDGLSTTTSISSLTELINALDVEVEANLVQIGSGSYSLSLASTATGAAKTLALAGLSVASGAGGPAAQEVQAISGLTLAQGDVFELTLADGTVLTAAALGAAPTLGDLVTALQADTDYAGSDVVITEGTGADVGKLILTYKTNADVGVATLRKTADEPAVTSTDGAAGTIEVQLTGSIVPVSGDIFELTLPGGLTLTTAALGPTPTITDVLDALKLDGNYTGSDVVLSVGTGADSDKLVLTFKTTGDKDVVTLTQNAVAIAGSTSVPGEAAAQEIQKTSVLAPAIGDVYRLTLPDGKVLETAPLTAATVADVVSKLTADSDYSAGYMTLTEGAGPDAGKLILTYTGNGNVSAANLVRTTAAGTLATTTAGSSGVASYGTLSASTLQDARDAFFSVNGLAVQRASNQVDDVVNGVTFSLNSPTVPAGGAISSLASADFSALSATTINVTKGAEDLSGAAVEDFVNAYNELVSFYKAESMSSKDPDARGVLNGDSTLRTFMDRVRGLYANGIRLADGSNISFSSIGVEVQRDGTLFLDKGDLNTAIANGLQDKFAQGVTLGYASSALSLTSFLTSSLRSSGIISSHITDIETQQTRLEDRVEEWEDKLARIEQRYYRQYAALDALLFRLQTTSNALTSAIESLVNSQKSG